MLDSHSDRVVTVHRAVLSRSTGAAPTAVSPRAEMERYLHWSGPVHSLCEVVQRDGQELISRRDMLTITVAELVELYDHGHVHVGRTCVTLVDAWPPGIFGEEAPRRAAVPEDQCGRELAGGYLCVRTVGHTTPCARMMDISMAELEAEIAAGDAARGPTP